MMQARIAGIQTILIAALCVVGIGSARPACAATNSLTSAFDAWVMDSPSDMRTYAGVAVQGVVTTSDPDTILSDISVYVDGFYDGNFFNNQKDNDNIDWACQIVQPANGNPGTYKGYGNKLYAHPYSDSYGFSQPRVINTKAQVLKSDGTLVEVWSNGTDWAP